MAHMTETGSRRRWERRGLSCFVLLVLRMAWVRAHEGLNEAEGRVWWSELERRQKMPSSGMLRTPRPEITKVHKILW